MRRPTTGGRQARRLSAPVARLCLVARLRLWAGVRHIRLRLPT
ncbi:hypothetical protein [Streptomyces sp. NPDC014764]